jgi:hypothetical protein
MVIKRVGPISCAKVLGLLYALIGFLVGAVISVLAVVVGGLVPDQAPLGATNQQMFGALFGVGAIVLLPIFYGLMGFIGGAIGAVIYNFVAGATGGLEIDVST